MEKVCYRRDLFCVLLVINLSARTYGHVTTVSSGSTLEPDLAPSLLLNTSPSSMIGTDDVMEKMTFDNVTSVGAISPTSAGPDYSSLYSNKLQTMSTNILLSMSSNLERELADGDLPTYQVTPSSSVFRQDIASGLSLLVQPSDTLSESSQQLPTTSIFYSEIHQNKNSSFVYTASQTSFMTSESLVTSKVIGQTITPLTSLNVTSTVIISPMISKIESQALIGVPEISQQMTSSSTGLLSEPVLTSSVLVEYTSNDYIDAVLTNIPDSSSFIEDDNMSSLQPSDINYLSSLEPTQSIKSTETSISTASDSSSYIDSDYSVMSRSALLSSSVDYPDPLVSSLDVNSYSIVTETFHPTSSSVVMKSSLSINPTSTQSVSTPSTSIPVNDTVPTPAKNKGGLSAGGKVALGICIPIMIIAILAVTAFLVYRRRNHAASWKLSDVVSYRPWSYSNASYYDDESSLIIPSLNK